MKDISLSGKKPCKRGEKSQEQTTSKKTSNVMSGQRTSLKETYNHGNMVVTPARGSMPGNKLASIVLTSKDKQNPNLAIKSSEAIATLCQMTKSTARKEMKATTQNIDNSSIAKSTERTDSILAKTKHFLSQQDSQKDLASYD
jgi:hypothetical protein